MLQQYSHRGTTLTTWVSVKNKKAKEKKTTLKKQPTVNWEKSFFLALIRNNTSRNKDQVSHLHFPWLFFFFPMNKRIKTWKMTCFLVECNRVFLMEACHATTLMDFHFTVAFADSNNLCLCIYQNPSRQNNFFTRNKHFHKQPNKPREVLVEGKQSKHGNDSWKSAF